MHFGPSLASKLPASLASAAVTTAVTTAIPTAPVSMSIALFQRQMDWRRACKEKLEKKRAELNAENPDRNLRFGRLGDASAAEHVDSYWEYRRLVGESDGGELLSEEAYAEIRKLAAKAARNRLFVSWRNRNTGMDCYMVGPDSRCFCGHSYKAHAWYNTESKRVHCRCPDCDCPGFDYVVGHGCFWIKCLCKHSHEDHRRRGAMGRCEQPGCHCGGFHSSFSCACGDAWADHYTCVETRAERAASHRPTHALCGGGPGEAAIGGITRMSSVRACVCVCMRARVRTRDSDASHRRRSRAPVPQLIPGVDRVETPLPFTDSGFFAAPLPAREGAEDVVQLLLASLPEDAAAALLDAAADAQAQLDIAAEDAAAVDSDAVSSVCLPCADETGAASVADGRNVAASTRASASAPSPAPAPARASSPSRPRQRTSTSAKGKAARIPTPPPATATAAHGPSSSKPPAKPAAKALPKSRSAQVKEHDANLEAEIAALTLRMAAPETSAATRHALKRQVALKQAQLKRGVAL